MAILSRRDFLKTTIGVVPLVAAPLLGRSIMNQARGNPIHLGGPVFKDFDDPVEWVRAHRRWGYSAAYCPLEADAPQEMVRAFEMEANKAGLIIAEVGAWSNPISPDDKVRKEAMEYCLRQLTLADNIGAKCCVNIAGSRDPQQWDGPHKDNLSSETFDMIVEVTRAIIDQVKPKRTFFSLETMPWIFPDSVESYIKLIKKIDRSRFAVHLDPVNLINSPHRYYNNTKIIKDAFDKLGGYIKSCHAKDTIIEEELTTHISETRPGLGNLDYAAFLQGLSTLDGIPLMLEHMEEPEEYREAAKYIRKVAKENGLRTAVI